MSPGLDRELVVAEVARERLVEADQPGAELGLPVVEGDEPVVDGEAPEADRERSPGLGGRLSRGGRVPGDVPVGGAVLELDQGEAGPIELDCPDDDGPAAAQRAPHRRRKVQHHAQLPYRSEGVAVEPIYAHDAQLVQAKGEVGEVPEQPQVRVRPVHPGVERLVHLRLHPLGDPPAEEQRQDHKERQHEEEERRGNEEPARDAPSRRGGGRYRRHGTEGKRTPAGARGPRPPSRWTSGLGRRSGITRHSG